MARKRPKPKTQGEVRKVNHTLNSNGKLFRDEGKHDPMTLVI